MCKGHGYRDWIAKQVQKHLPKTKLQRMNHTYDILRARRGMMSESDGRKNGIMLDRCRVLEAKIKAEEEGGLAAV